MEDRLAAVEHTLHALVHAGQGPLSNQSTQAAGAEAAFVTPASQAAHEDAVEVADAADADRTVVMASERDTGYFGMSGPANYTEPSPDLFA